MVAAERNWLDEITDLTSVQQLDAELQAAAKLTNKPARAALKTIIERLGLDMPTPNKLDTKEPYVNALNEALAVAYTKAKGLRVGTEFMYSRNGNVFWGKIARIDEKGFVHKTTRANSHGIHPRYISVV